MALKWETFSSSNSLHETSYWTNKSLCIQWVVGGSPTNVCYFAHFSHTLGPLAIYWHPTTCYTTNQRLPGLQWLVIGLYIPLSKISDHLDSALILHQFALKHSWTDHWKPIDTQLTNQCKSRCKQVQNGNRYKQTINNHQKQTRQSEKCTHWHFLQVVGNFRKGNNLLAIRWVWICYKTVG